MKKPQQQTLQLDDEATLVVSGEETKRVAPRFDDEETLVARPVVPLEGDAPERPTIAPLDAPDYRSPGSARRSVLLALVLFSVLVGGVLGGAGLYLYQRQSQDPAVNPAATTTQPAAPDAAAQAPPAAEGSPAPPAAAPAQPTDAPVADAPEAEETAAPEDEEEEATAARAPAPENVPASERRDAPAGDSTPKRGPKGERDTEIERRATPRADGNGAREARRVDSIVYRPRRAPRRERARRDDAPDRLRRIFEGTP